MRRVSPNVYTKKYYLSDCTGYEEFNKGYGRELEVRFKELIKYFEIKPGQKVLDIGCGRGEMVIFSASNGAEAVGIDYSRNAIKLANLAKSKQPSEIRKKIYFRVMDAKKLLFKESEFDLIILTDVVEHLYSEELEIMFAEIKRVLRNGGKVIIHTAPNKTFNDFFYKYYCYPVSTLIVFLWKLFTRKNYPNIAKPSEIRTESHAIMHINEPTYFSLSKMFKEFKFIGRIESTNITVIKPSLSLKDKIFNFIVFFHPLSKRFPLNIFLGSDFISILTNKK